MGKRRRETRTEGSSRKGGSRQSSGPGGSDPAPWAPWSAPCSLHCMLPSVLELSPAIANSTHLFVPSQLLGAFPHSVTGPEHMEFSC